ncbi:MAG: MATE family efflux transporter, partial [Bacillales bacterium]|nr:MATE family efflux transporter [Bacillales bacterium]
MKENKMGVERVNKLIWTMGLPMVLSMVLQALYNVIDTMFIINMGSEGVSANLALSSAFPIQIVIIAIGVGSGVGINALLSKILGQKDNQKVTKIINNGFFIIIFFYLLFLLFGLFLAHPYMKLMSNDEIVIKMGTDYLKICCCLSFGSIGFSIVERFLISTGKTNLSMISQIFGAITNIILDYVFIYLCNMGILGAAYATVIGQILSLFAALLFHFIFNKEIKNELKSIKPDLKIIREIYKIGFPAFLMQSLLALMMFGILLIFKVIKSEYIFNLMTGSFGIYYKLMQISLFATFGLSNTLISVVSYNVGIKNKKRIKDTIKYGIIITIIVSLVITLIFEVFAKPISYLFALTLDESSLVSKNDVISTCQTALHIASIGYIFMGFNVAIQGILQGFNKVM